MTVSSHPRDLSYFARRNMVYVHFTGEDPEAGSDALGFEVPVGGHFFFHFLFMFSLFVCCARQTP